MYNEKIHLKILNFLARLFGGISILGGIGFLYWASEYWRHPQKATDISTISGNATLDFGVAGGFCLLIGTLFLMVKPYRPDANANNQDGKP